MIMNVATERTSDFMMGLITAKVTKRRRLTSSIAGHQGYFSSNHTERGLILRESNAGF